MAGPRFAWIQQLQEREIIAGCSYPSFRELALRMYRYHTTSRSTLTNPSRRPSPRRGTYDSSNDSSAKLNFPKASRTIPLSGAGARGTMTGHSRVPGVGEEGRDTLSSREKGSRPTAQIPLSADEKGYHGTGEGIEVEERDQSGNVIATYVASSSSDKGGARVDIIVCPMPMCN
jgi:hypothetical protein